MSKLVSLAALGAATPKGGNWLRVFRQVEATARQLR